MLGSENLYEPTIAPTLARDRMMPENGLTGLYRSKSGSVHRTMHHAMTTRLDAMVASDAKRERRSSHTMAMTPPASAVAPTTAAPSSEYRCAMAKSHNAADPVAASNAAVTPVTQVTAREPRSTAFAAIPPI